MRGDGLHRIPRSKFWYYKIKVNRCWHSVSTKTTNYVQAKRKRSDALKAQQDGWLPEGEISRWPFERAASHYLQTDAALHLRANSLKKEATFLARPMKLFGGIACELITAAHIQQLQGGIKDAGLKNSYNNLVVGATARVLKHAKVWRRIRDDVKRLSEKDIKPVARVLEREEKKRLFQVAGANPNWTIAYAAALIAATTTARGADLRGLRWSNVDLFEGVMTIPDSKSEAGKRRIPLNPDGKLGFRLLLDRAVALRIAGSADFVFPACENGRMTQLAHRKRGALRGVTSRGPLG